MPQQAPVVRRHHHARARDLDRHRHAYWHCDQIIVGGGRLTYAAATRPDDWHGQIVSAGDWWLVPAGCLHGWHYAAGTRLCSIRFVLDQHEPWPWRLRNRGARALATALPSLISGRTWRQEAVSRVLQRTLEDLVALERSRDAAATAMAPGREPGFANRVKDAVKERHGQPTRIAHLAAALHMHPRSLRRAFVAETGQRLKEWIDSERARHIEDLLCQGLPIATIADRLGFSHPSDCARLFRRVHGTSPSAWRPGPMAGT